MRTEPGTSSFPITRWSLVIAAGGSRDTGARVALEELCALYWKPVYGYVRARGNDREAARDLTQGFFAYLLEKALLGRAQSDRGRFRSFLLGCVNHFLSDSQSRLQTQKRGGDWARLEGSIDEVEGWLQLAGPAGQQPDQLYDWACAISLMNQALERLGAEYRAPDRQRVFVALRPYLECDGGLPDYAETAAVLETTAGTVKVLVHRLRRRYRSGLRSLVAETLSDPLAVDDELRHLCEALEAVRWSPGER